MTHEEAAEALGVSVGTVANWRSGRSHIRVDDLARCLSLLAARGVVSQEMRRLMSAMLADQGASANALARLFGAEYDTSGKVVLVVSDVPARGLGLTTAGVRGYLPSDVMTAELVLDVGSPDRSVKRLSGLIATRNVHGVVFVCSWKTRLLDQLSETFGEAHVPLVGVNLPPAPIGLPAWSGHRIGVDNYSLGYQAGRWLASRGHRKLGYLGITTWSLEPRRFEGFRQAVMESGGSVAQEHVYWATPDESAGLEGTVADDPSVVAMASVAAEERRG